MENIGTWVAVGGFVLTIGGVIWKLAIAIDRVTQAVKGMAKETDLVEQRGQLREHSETLERHEGQLTKQDANIESARRSIAVLEERTKTPKLA